MVNLAIFDYGAGNIFSLKNSLEQAGASVDVITSFDKPNVYSGLLLPGVGNFDPAIQSINENSKTKFHDYVKEDIEHFMQSLAQNLNCCVHITVKYGDNDHHKIEAAIKSLAVALRNASSKDKKQKGIPSTKGAM